MAYRLITSALLLSTTSAFVRRDTSSGPAPGVAPRQYLVEYADDKSSNVAQFFSDLSNNGLSVERKVDITSDLFHGSSFKLDDKHDEKAAIEQIDALPVVKKVWPMRHYYPQAATKVRPGAYNDTFSPHVMAGVDKLHAQGYTGKGRHIAILDTGVDYKHPALGGGFGPGFKVTKGYDFVGNAYNGTNTPVDSGPDPYTNCSAHGTHVAGIIGANNNEFNFTGVVPDATLSMYKVFGCDGSVQDDILIKATLKAFEERPDAISISIGGKNGWTEGPWTAVAARVAAAGTPILLAAGNDGADGMFTGSEAADGIGVIAVGSIDNTEIPEISQLYPYSVNGKAAGRFNVQQSETPIKDIELPLYAISSDPTIANDGCDPLPDSTPDLSGKIVMVRRGSCTFAQKAQNVAAKGAEYLLFYNNKPGLLQNAGVPPLKGIAMTRAETGASFVQQLNSGSKIVLSFTNSTGHFETSPNNVTGGYMSTFSSWYPNNEAYFKPEVSGPGGNILSTVPLALGGYAVLSGTSMATPFVAGVVGLMRQARPDLTAKQVRAILGSTATPVQFNNGAQTSDILAPIIQQGGGLVNAVKAITSNTVLDVANLPLNDTAHFTKTQSFSITNRGSKAATYSLSSLDAATAFSLDSNYTAVPVVQFPELSSTPGVKVSFDTKSVSVPAGKSVKINVNFAKTTGLDSKRIPVYGGYIKIKGSNGDLLSLPYGGIASNLKDATVLSVGATGTPVLSRTSDASSSAVAPNTAFQISKTNPNADLPLLLTNLAMGSSLIRADLIPSKGAKNTTTILGVKTLGSIAGFPLEYQPRNQLIPQAFEGKLSDGSYVPAGNYTILVRALRIFGDSKKASDYDKVATVPFSITYV